MINEEADKELCPKCNGVMVSSQQAILREGKFIGAFDAVKCSKCSYVLFTEKDYDRMIKEMNEV